MKKGAVLLPMLMFLSLASIASALRIGVSSYYVQPYFPSACYNFEQKGVFFASVNKGLWQEASACFGDQKNGVYLASVNDELWDGGNICGQYYQVYCPNALNAGEQQPCSKIGDTIGALVIVVDHCNDCGGATMLLSQEIFQMIANIDVGRIQLNYKKFEPYD
ncbi:hypothetical protein KFK09_003019 [Dendrobium nobile]|uniref:Expansin-like EG45 domain-containing protein n=1 Tax=Dendrobium nobile TaxID=94219 RepID=A0A8T3C5J1_DENNO|nr:hypothetical protein KFK09_003019 [Dendrobium nobile]